ncbi:MAG: histidine kinase, partial [Psychrosphaera sp.]|nr:histidine kinase [Psychrosphaera sp.]
PIMILGGLLIIALYFLQLYWIYARDKPFLMFSLLCFAVSALLITESYKGLFGYTYDWHIFRLTLVGFWTGLVAVLLPLFLLYQFELPFKQRLTLGAALTMLAINTWVPGYDFSAEIMFVVAFIWALIIALYAWKKHKQGAMLTVLGLLVVVLTKVLVPYGFEDSLFFPSFGILILCVLTTLTQRMKVTQQERNEALVNSAQLEIMLLKKNIQPHFILNTLTSIEQWIEEEPQTAVKFIDALADEFKVMNAMADQKQVPLAQELDLCRSHLQIMSYRKDMQFELATINTNPELLIPPAIIHTLIENALTHNIYLQGTINMPLTQSTVEQGICLELTAPLNLPKNLPNKEPNKEANKLDSQSNGTGLKYIRSRLEESYPGLWDLQEQQTEQYWITKIIFKDLNGGKVK